MVAEKTKSSTIPVQNTGADQAASENAVTRLLKGPRGLRAACTPRTEPRVSDPIAHGLPRGSMPGIASPRTAQSTLSEALRSAGGIRDCAHRARVFARTATLLHRAGDASAVGNCLSSALAAAGTIPEGGMRASELAEIARAQAATREREAARTTLAKANACLPPMGGGKERSRALASISRAEAELGDGAAALASVDRIEAQYDRFEVRLVVKLPPARRSGSVAGVTGACVCDGSGVKWPRVG